eukprot:scaffold1586_cov158-Amphora_coffeaeformis.AAC.13
MVKFSECQAGRTIADEAYAQLADEMMAAATAEVDEEDVEDEDEIDDVDLDDIVSFVTDEEEDASNNSSLIMNWKPVEMPSFFSKPLMDEQEELVSSKSELNLHHPLDKTYPPNDVKEEIIETNQERKARKHAEKMARKAEKEKKAKKTKKDTKKDKYKNKSKSKKKEINVGDKPANEASVPRGIADEREVEKLAGEDANEEYDDQDEEEEVYDEGGYSDEEEYEEVEIDDNMGDYQSDYMEDEDSHSFQEENVHDDGFSLGYDEEAGDMDCTEMEEQEESESSTLWVSADTTKYQVQHVHSGSCGDSKGSPASFDGDHEQGTSPEGAVSIQTERAAKSDAYLQLDDIMRQSKSSKNRYEKHSMDLPLEDKLDEEQASNPWDQEVVDPQRETSYKDPDASRSTRLRLRNAYSSDGSRASSLQSDRSPSSASRKPAYELPWLKEQERPLLLKNDEEEDSHVHTRSFCNGGCVQHSNGKVYVSVCVTLITHIVWLLLVLGLLYIVLLRGGEDDGDRALPLTTQAPTGPPEQNLISREPDSPKCFETTEELRLAVEGYLGPFRALVSEAYGNMSQWCVSDITDFSELLADVQSFNEDLSQWDLSNAVTTRAMFRNAVAFNQPLLTWRMSKVQDLSEMFRGAVSFNQTSLETWDVSSVTNMSYTFASAKAFNANLSSWNVAAVTDMSSMFFGAASFNRAIETWNVSKLVSARNMFREATSFDQPLSFWNTSQA